MGGKRKRQRQYIFLFPAACLIILIMAGCSLLVGHPAPPEPIDYPPTGGEEKSTNETTTLGLRQQETQQPDREIEIRKLRKTIQAQNIKIHELKRQIEQLKAVDLELEPTDQVGEVP